MVFVALQKCVAQCPVDNADPIMQLITSNKFFSSQDSVSIKFHALGLYAELCCTFPSSTTHGMVNKIAAIM